MGEGEEMVVGMGGRSHKDSDQTPQSLKKEENRSGMEPRSFCLPG